MPTHSVSARVILRATIFPILVSGLIVAMLPLLFGVEITEHPLAITGLCFVLGLIISVLLLKKLKQHSNR